MEKGNTKKDLSPFCILLTIYLKFCSNFACVAVKLGTLTCLCLSFVRYLPINHNTGR